MVAALRWPTGERIAKNLAFVDQTDRVVAELGSDDAVAIDPAALFEGLDPAARTRLLRLVTDTCAMMFRLDGSAGFAATCRRLVLELFPRPGRLVVQTDLTARTVLAEAMMDAGFGVVRRAVTIGNTGVRVSAAAAPAVRGGDGRTGTVPYHLALDAGLIAADALVLLFGADSLACRRIESTAGRRPSLRGWLEQKRTVPAVIRESIASGVAALAPAEPQAAALLNDLQFGFPLSRRRILAPSTPFGGDIELAAAWGTGGLFLSGWLHDPHEMLAEIIAISPLGNRRTIAPPVHRHPRPDIQKQYRAKGIPVAADRLGFVAYAEGDLDPLPTFQTRIELVLKSGARLDLVPPPQAVDPARARAAVLGSIPAAHLGMAALESCIAPAASRLHAAHLATRRPPERIDIGPPPAAPELSVIVPLYRNLDFLRFQLAAFAIDPDFGRAEVIFVLDSPEQRAALEHLLLGLHGLYALPVTLVVMSANFGYSAANNAAAAMARSDRLLFLNSDVIPDRPGWMTILAEALDAHPGVGAVGAKLLFEDESLQHAGLYFARDSRGRWLNRHFYKGLPRDFAPARIERDVPGLTGACLMVRRHLFERVGGFTEDYIIGDYEDSDLCLKINEAGFRVRYVPSAELYHLERKSIEQHTGYTRSVACEYNSWLHARRWDAAMTEAMRRETYPIPFEPVEKTPVTRAGQASPARRSVRPAEPLARLEA